ncbi:cytochrome c class I [uncultured Candidatus Thioglobus sp.]|nr:cytochrome c class I [uncultured Candidatus Thioglobus sp.]
MIRKTIIKSTLLVAAIALSVQSQAVPSAEALSYTCAGCHGTNGASTGDAIPSIAGLSSTYLVDAMKAYKNDERDPTIMNRIAKGYSEEQFELMGSFFEAQEVHKNRDQTFDVAKAAKGKKLHNKYCSKCHTDAGIVAEDDAGQLSGNAKLFLQYSLADFHDGTRSQEKKMKKKIKKMLKRDKEAFDLIVNYYVSGKK